MKKTIKYFALAAAVLAAFAACSPEEVIHPSEAGIASAQNYEPVIAVDQETNQVTFSVDAKGVIPVWVFADKSGEWTQYSAQNGLQKIFASMGDYQVRMYIMNANGMSPDYKECSFHINNTIMSFDKYLTFIAGGKDGESSKEWRIDNDVAGHLGCGESGSDGTNWWSAAKDDKKDFGVYDDRLTFTGGYAYTYDPGDGGTVYVNKDVTVAPFGDYRNPDEDYMVPVDRMDATYSFEVQGDDLYLVLPAGTLFPYIANDDFVADPRFKVQSMTAKAMELIIDNGAIAWHYTLTSGAAAQVFNGFKYNSEFNIWKKNVDDGSNYEFISTYYAHGGSWEANPDDITYDYSGSTLTVTLPDESDQRWQAQLHIGFPELEITSAKNYDFSCIIQSNNAFLEGTGVTFKIVDKDNDGLFLIEPVIPVESAYEDIIYYVSDVPGVDIAKGNVKVAFDFGGCRAGTELTIKNIVLKDHADDDGTVLPIVDPEPEVVPEEYKYDSEFNLWKAADAAHTYSYYYAPGWSQIADPETTQNGSEYTLEFPSATTDRWQAQFFIIPDAPIALSSASNYDFSLVLNSTTDINNVTLKLTDTTNDGNFLFTENVSLTAFEDYIFDRGALAGIDADAVKMVFDFGGNPEGTTVTIKRIVLKDSANDDGTHKGTPSQPTELDYNASNNIWKAADEAHTYSYYYAPGWSQIANPETTQDGSKYTLSLPSATTDQWQAQFFIIPDSPIAMSSANKYNFQVKILSNNSFNGVTIKLTDSVNDGTFLCADRVEVTAYEEYLYLITEVDGVDSENMKLVFDFGGCPEGTEIEISDIVLQKVASPMTYDSAANLWKAADEAHSCSYYYAPGWSQIADPETTQNGSEYTLAFPSATSDQWQAQFFIIPDAAIAMSAAKTYDVQVTIQSNNSFNGATIKLTDSDNDGNYICADRVELEAYEDYVYTKMGAALSGGADSDAVKFVFDFGGCPDNTEISIKDIIVRESE